MEKLNVKVLREKLNLSKRDLAHLMGADPKTIYNWENGGKISVQYKRKLLALADGDNTLFKSMQNNVNGHNVTGIGNNVSSSTLENSELLKIIERRDVALANAQEQLSRSQEQITELLKLVLKLQK